MKKKLKYYQKAGKYTNVKPKGGETFEVYEELSNKFPLLEKYKQAFYEAYPNAPEDVANSVAIASMHKFFPDSNVKKEFLTKMGGGDYFKGYSLYNEFINSSKNQFDFLDMGTHHSTKADAELTSASEQDIFNRFYTDVEEIPEQRKKTKVRSDTNYEPLLLSRSIPDKNYKSGKREVILGRTQLIRDDEKAREFERRIQEEVLNKENIPLTIKVSKNEKPLFKDDDPYYATYYYPDGYEEDKVAEAVNNFGGITGLRDKIKGVYNDMFPNEMEGYEITPAQKVEKFKFKKRDVTSRDESKKQFGGLNNTNMKKKMQKGQMFPSFPTPTPTSNKGVSDAEYNSNRELYLRADKLIYDLAKLEEDMKESAYYLQKDKNYEGENTISALKKRRNEILSEYNFIKDRIGDDIDEIIPNEMFNRVINYDFVKGETKNPKSYEIAYDRAIEMTTDKKQSKKQSKQDLANVSTKDLWEMLTQSSWQEAKKQGLTDGSFEQNLALRTKLIEGNADLLKQKFSGKELQFAKGGKVYGASHQEGGVPAVDANTGEQVAEVEGGERIFSREDTQAMEQMVMQIANAKSEQEGNQLAMQLGYMVADMIMKQMQRQGEENMGQDMEEMPMEEEAMPMAMGGRKLKANKVLELLNSY